MRRSLVGIMVGLAVLGGLGVFLLARKDPRLPPSPIVPASNVIDASAVLLRGAEAALVVESSFPKALPRDLRYSDRQLQALKDSASGTVAAYTSGSLQRIIQRMREVHLPELPNWSEAALMSRTESNNRWFLDSISIPENAQISIRPYILRGVRVGTIASQGENTMLTLRKEGMPCHEQSPESQNAVAVSIPIQYAAATGGAQRLATLTLLLQWNSQLERWEQIGLQIAGFPSDDWTPHLPG